MTDKKDVLRPVDDDARQQAKTLIRTARFAALACLNPATGTPLASQVNVATDTDGSPVFLISQLSAHFGALETDPRCSVLFGSPGKGDPAAYPRITVIGRATMIVDDAQRDHIRRRFLAINPKSELYVDFGDFAFWRVVPSAASLNAGFGKAYEMVGGDILNTLTNCPGIQEIEAGAVAHMNEDHADAVALYATRLLNKADGAWQVANIDPEGLDLRLGDDVARLWFDKPLRSADDLRQVLAELARKARASEATDSKP